MVRYDVQLFHGDCLDVLRTLPACSIDSVVTDPPAGIAFMGKAWDGNRGGRDLWIAWLADRLAECYRVLKPGAHVVVWALPKTSGWTHRAIEDAGFEHRHGLAALHGQGFPKSLDVSKAIDEAAGAVRHPIGERVYAGGHVRRSNGTDLGMMNDDDWQPTSRRQVTAPATPEAAQWEGWGTALKPGWEMWYLARKPLDSTVAGTVTRWGTGALNVDGCRVPSEPWTHRHNGERGGVSGGIMGTPVPRTASASHSAGRWPADVVLSHNPTCDGVCSPGCAVAELDQQSGTLKSGAMAAGTARANREGWSGPMPEVTGADTYGDSGGASRFFPTFKYQAKPSTREKSRWQGPALMRWHGEGPALMRWHAPRNRHPTVKPVELMRWLVRLVTPPGGVVLDPFAGSGTTLVAATLEGFNTIGVEESMEHVAYVQGRVRWAESFG